MTLKIDIRILNLYDDWFGLRVASEDQQTFDFFEAQGLLGDGCTWAAIVDVLLRENMPDELEKLELSCESESMLLMSQGQVLLKRIEEMIQANAQSEAAILRAIARANPDMLE